MGSPVVGLCTTTVLTFSSSQATSASRKDSLHLLTIGLGRTF